MLWPGYDEDVKGFALRPLITHDGDHWELLPPLGYWNTKTGNWMFLPAYSLDESFGLTASDRALFFKLGYAWVL